MNRRTALKLGAFGVVGSAGLYGGYRILPPRPSRTLPPVDALARRFCDSLNDEQRAETCVNYDHPLRQYYNRGVEGGGRAILFGFNRGQRQLLTDILYAGLSDEGRRRIPEEYFTRWSGVHSMRVLLCGDPASPPYQMILSGVHLNLRIGGKSREGVAFGGPQVYGDQRGNEIAGLPGNLYRDQFLLGQRLLQNLDSGRKRYALLNEAPVQTQIEIQGRGGSFPGIPVAELEPQGKAMAHELVERIFSAYPAEDVEYARECLAENGGVEGLSLSYYQHGEDGNIPEGQVFRLEGPGAVLYFRGYPHVHAFLHIVRDADSPLSLGEPLGTNPAWLDKIGVKKLFEAALRAETGANMAYYDAGSVAGRLRPGLIRSGDIYALESWQEKVQILQVRGSNLDDTLRASMRASQVEPNPDRIYTVATTGFGASDLSRKLGRSLQSRRLNILLRDLTVKYLRSHTFPAAQG